jgi:hypothetical protein
MRTRIGIEASRTVKSIQQPRWSSKPAIGFVWNCALRPVEILNEFNYVLSAGSKNVLSYAFVLPK